MDTEYLVTSILIAPCGMNCGICSGYLRDKKKPNKCYGCNDNEHNKPKSCMSCIIMNCELLAKTESKFCYECEKYPCRRLKQLDKRYKTKYNMSMLENLEYIRENGIDKFVDKENEKWACTHCEGIINVHKGYCILCQSKYLTDEIA